MYSFILVLAEDLFNQIRQNSSNCLEILEFKEFFNFYISFFIRRHYIFLSKHLGSRVLRYRNSKV